VIGKIREDDVDWRNDVHIVLTATLLCTLVTLALQRYALRLRFCLDFLLPTILGDGLVDSQ
jgi:hypothetical protein